MIKKLKVITILCCMLVACSSNNQKEESDIADYTIETAEYNEDKVYVKYPQVNGLGDNKDEQVNEMIRRIIIDEHIGKEQELLRSQDEGTQRNTKYIVELDYDIILKDTSIISILFKGKESYSFSSFQNSVMKGITIDLDSLKLVSLEEYISIDSRIMSRLRNYTYVYQSWQNITLNYDEKDKDEKERYMMFSEYIDEDLRSEYNSIYKNFKENSSDERYYNYVVSESKIYIKVSVMQVAGDYALIEIDRE